MDGLPHFSFLRFQQQQFGRRTLPPIEQQHDQSNTDTTSETGIVAAGE